MMRKATDCSLLLEAATKIRAVVLLSVLRRHWLQLICSDVPCAVLNKL